MIIRETGIEASLKEVLDYMRKRNEPADYGYYEDGMWQEWRDESGDSAADMFWEEVL